MTKIEVMIEMARFVMEDYDGYEVFASEEEIRAYLPEEDELDYPVPEIWTKRIAACEEIIREKSYPCIFDAENAIVESRIDEDGFKFDGVQFGVTGI